MQDAAALLHLDVLFDGDVDIAGDELEQPRLVLSKDGRIARMQLDDQLAGVAQILYGVGADVGE